MSIRHATEIGAGEGQVRRDEYDAMRAGAVLLPHDAVWKTFAGAKAVDVINGLVTQDVAGLEPGVAGLAVALTPKGKVVADLLIVRVAADRFLVGASAASAAAWHELVRKYVNPRLATVVDEAERLRSWLVAGPRAMDLAGRALGGATTDGGETAESTVVAKIAIDAPIPLALVIGPAAASSPLGERLSTAGAAIGSEALGALLRIETGWPAVGFGMDENTIPQEANLDSLGAISFTKGCYTGQETVARVHFRGHVNRHLRGLRLDRPVPVGTALADAAGKVVGDVRVVAHSPAWGVVALAMVRREIADGDTLTTMSAAGTDSGVPAPDPVSARVVVLPFR